MKTLNYSRIRCVPDNAVYIGRRMPNIEESKFHNPFKMFDESHRHEVCIKYRKHLWGQIKTGDITIDDLLELDGKNLVCWCAPLECHGEVLIRAVAWAKAERLNTHGEV